MSDTQRTDRAQTIIGTAGFVGSFVVALLGTFANNDALLIIGAVIALAGAVTCITLEARRKVKHAEATPMVEEPLSPHA